MSLGKTRAAAAVLALMVAALVLGLAAEASPAQASSLRYFGYFAARITAAEGDHQPEVAGRSNLNWIQISDPDRYRPEVLKNCAPGGCIISTGHEFFRGCDSAHDPNCELYPNYAERWSKLAAAVSTEIGKVGAFYLMDEPQYKGATKAELETAAATIKATYPTIPVMMVEAGPQVTSSLHLPLNVDWVGFDWYCQEFKVVEEKLATLSALALPWQSLFLVPESAPLAACGGAKGHATDAEIAALQSEYFRLAVSNPRVIGLLNFGFWTSGYGPAQLPRTFAAHAAIWNYIVATNQPPPPPAPAPAPPEVAPPPPPPSHAKGPPKGFPVRIVSEQLRVGRGGPLAIGLRCPGANSGACEGRLSLRLLGHRPRPIGAARFAVDPGKGKAVEVAVKRRLRGSLLRLAHRRKQGRVRVRAATAAGKSVSVLPVRGARSKHARRG